MKALDVLARLQVKDCVHAEAGLTVNRKTLKLGIPFQEVLSVWARMSESCTVTSFCCLGSQPSDETPALIHVVWP
jgi:hypothetical protein